MIKKYHKIFTCGVTVVLLSSCSTVKDNFSIVSNHLGILKNARSINILLEEKTTHSELKQKLLLVGEIKEFGHSYLALKKTNSYSSYADIEREVVVWNVIATKNNSFQMKEWCYLFVGCFNYRGFYSKHEAESYSTTLIDEEEMEVAINVVE